MSATANPLADEESREVIAYLRALFKTHYLVYWLNRHGKWLFIDESNDLDLALECQQEFEYKAGIPTKLIH